MLKCKRHPSPSTTHTVCVRGYMRIHSNALSLTGAHRATSPGSSCRPKERRQTEGFDKWRRHCLDGRSRDCDWVSVPGTLTHSVGYGVSLLGRRVGWYQRQADPTLPVKKMEKTDRMKACHRTMCEIDAAACRRSLVQIFVVWPSAKSSFAIPAEFKTRFNWIRLISEPLACLQRLDWIQFLP